MREEPLMFSKQSLILILFPLCLAMMNLFILDKSEPAAAKPALLDYSACEHYDDFPPSNDPNRQGGRKAECKVLIDLYNATNGPNWTDDGSRGGGWGLGSYCFW